MLDYHLPNDGSDDEAAPEDRIVKRFRSNHAGSVQITQNHSASQLTQRQSSPADSSQQPELTDDGLVDRSSVSSESESSRKKPQNQSLWAQFDILELPGKLWWPKRGKGPIEDREILCTRCNWRTTDSARATSTSNMRFHPTKHGISSGGSESSENDKSSTKQPSIASFFQKRAEDNAARSLDRNLVRWIVLNNMAFDAIKSPAFQKIFRDLGISLPHDNDS
ncbi:hypothetical protein LIPSTDRAFT_5757 [Lipomyces starkeyi NRRL Y-11557]|uniref:BED-type domain-containing protein n=1 Tax=Lipomyces starkeyi NRRL Y-11557 TaxID=675824 RepID=A0A1E3PXW1_LIPST|nr:hypothetical protein LIPSTDRAFT_5757 [Lipomyces starkeyi NRRL Y-11557]